MSSPWQPQFLFATCQRGAEQALKRELAVGRPELRLSFSRPGFVTFKMTAEPFRPTDFQLHSTFARSWGFSMGKVRGELMDAMAREVWGLEGLAEFLAVEKLADLHVWQRDAAVPGEHGFQPGLTPLAELVRQRVAAQADEGILPPTATTSRKTPRNQWVLDIVLVEPNEWWVGCHLTTNRHACWPGGVPQLQLPDEMISRAYLKMAEALEWGALPIAPGETFVEIGCSPGGSCQALLDRGLQVIGIDPAEVDERLLEHPQFVHVRRRSKEVPHRQFRDVDWLAADLNMAPDYTLDVVEDVVRQKTGSIRGLVLTLKPSDWDLIDEIPRYIQRVQSWGYRDVRTRQLAFNRQEICLVALRSRAQRRIRRSASTRHERVDPAHSGQPPAPH